MKFWHNVGKGFQSMASVAVFLASMYIVQFAFLGFVIAAVFMLARMGNPFGHEIVVRFKEAMSGPVYDAANRLLEEFGEIIYLITLVSQICTVLFLVLYYKKRVKYRAADLGVGTLGLKNVLLAVLLGCSAMLTVVCIFDITGYTPLSETTETYGKFGLLAVIIGAPLAEEYTFRGFMFGRMRDRGVPAWFIIIFTAIMFGLVHGNLEQISYAIPFGILIGAFRAKYDNLWLCMIVHACANFAGSFPYALLGKITSHVIVYAAPVVLAVCVIVMICDHNTTGLFQKKEDAVQTAEA